jgi:hypothetical protein
MERIELELKPIANKIIKVGNQKVEIRPYITTEDSVNITQICLEHFGIDESSFERYVMVKCIFDMLVIYKCTNIKVDGVVSKKVKTTTNIKIDIDSKIVNKFDSTQIIKIVSPYIYNYKEVYNQVCETIALKNEYNALNLLGKTVFNADEMQKNVTASIETIKQLKEKEPEIFNQMINQTFIGEI